ncbi:hypothetical protein Tco_0152153 [Tanacetum coccineum]
MCSTTTMRFVWGEKMVVRQIFYINEDENVVALSCQEKGITDGTLQYVSTVEALVQTSVTVVGRVTQVTTVSELYDVDSHSLLDTVSAGSVTVVLVSRTLECVAVERYSIWSGDEVLETVVDRMEVRVLSAHS